MDDGCVVPGAGAFEIAVHVALKKAIDEVKGRERLGLQAYSDALLVIPKVLAQNAGFDSQEVIVKLLSEAHDVGGPVGMDCSSGEVSSSSDSSGRFLSTTIFGIIPKS